MNKKSEKTSEKIDLYLGLGLIPKSSLVIALDTSRHYLGQLCARGHDYLGTGQTVRGLTHRNCMICMRLNAYVWRQENVERARETGRQYEATDQGKARRKAAMQKWREKETSMFFSIVQGARSRSVLRGLPYDITPQHCIDLFEEQGRKCYWLGVDLLLSGPPRHPFKPSLERLIPQLGYTMGNVVIASNFANRARGDTPADEFRQMLHIVSHALHKRHSA